MASGSKDKLGIVTVDHMEGMRSVGERFTRTIEVDASQLAVNVHLFLAQMDQVMAEAPETVGRLELSEIEIHAEITGKGQVVLWGVGGEVGVGGGIKFVFKKS